MGASHPPVRIQCGTWLTVALVLAKSQIAFASVEYRTIKGHAAPTGGLVVDDGLSPLVSAVDRQTASLDAAVRALSAGLSAFASSRSLSASDGVMRAVLKGLGEVGATKVKAERALRGVADVEDRLVAAEGEARALRKDVRRLKKESKKLAAEASRSRGVLDKEVLKLNVYFDAVRNTEFNTAGNLSYDFCAVNRGAGMDFSSGVFRAPLSGVYLFSFHANTVKGNDGLVLLRHNGDIVAGAFDTDNFKHNSLAQTVLIPTRVGDQVWVEVLSGGVRSNDNLYVHFVGILLSSDEEAGNEIA